MYFNINAGMYMYYECNYVLLCMYYYWDKCSKIQNLCSFSMLVYKMFMAYSAIPMIALYGVVYNYICNLISRRDLVPQNNFDQILTFNCS